MVSAAPFVAALILVDLDDQLLTLAHHVLDAGAGDFDVVALEESPADFLERQKPVPFVAVVDEGGFEAGLDAGDDSFVDVPFTLLFSGGFDVQVNELLTIYDGDPQFFGLGRIEQHAFHSCTPALKLTGTATFWSPAQGSPRGYYSDRSVIMAGLE